METAPQTREQQIQARLQALAESDAEMTKNITEAQKALEKTAEAKSTEQQPVAIESASTATPAEPLVLKTELAPAQPSTSAIETEKITLPPRQKPKKETVRITLPPKPKGVVKIDLPPKPTEAPETIEKPETKTFPKAFIEEKIRTLLSSQEGITGIKDLKVEGGKDQIFVTIRVTAEKWFAKADISVKLVLEKRVRSIKVVSCNISADKMEKKIDGMIRPQLDNVPQLLNDYIEKEEGKKIEKIDIKNGELVVIFKKSELKPAPIPESASEQKSTIPTISFEQGQREEEIRQRIRKNQQRAEELQKRLVELKTGPEKTSADSRSIDELKGELSILESKLENTSKWNFVKRFSLGDRILDLKIKILEMGHKK